MRSRLRFRPNLRRLVFWSALGVMLLSASTGLIWNIIDHTIGDANGSWLKMGFGPLTAITIGIGALLIAAVFALLEFTNPMFHPESQLFDWSDVDTLRQLSKQEQLPSATRDFARSLADRIAVVLPGRAALVQGQSQPKTPAVRRP